MFTAFKTGVKKSKGVIKIEEKANPKRGRPKKDREAGVSAHIGNEIKELLTKKVDSEDIKKCMDNLGIPPSRQNWAKAIGLAVVKKAASGDKSAVEFVRDIAGDKNEPGEKTSAAQVIIITGEDKIAD